MKKNGNTRITPILLIILIGFALFKWAVAGDLNPVSGPSDSGSAMYTLDDIYNRLSDNIIGTKRTGSFEEPTADPGATGHTLDEIYNLAIPTQVPVTGQTSISYYYSYGDDWTIYSSDATGDDGDLQAGIPVPSPRFTDNGDGTVTDNLTGLIWLQKTNNNTDTWCVALTDANNLAHGSYGLADNSAAGDWRLPSIKELLSLVDYGQDSPCLATGHPFTYFQSYLYWSGTTDSASPDYAWVVDMESGMALRNEKINSYNYPFYLPVRDRN